MQATYAVSLLGDMASNRGKVQLAVDGVKVGSPIDEYAAVAKDLTVTPGSVHLSAGQHLFKFTVTGDDPVGKRFAFALGSITLTP